MEGIPSLAFEQRATSCACLTLIALAFWRMRSSNSSWSRFVKNVCDPRVRECDGHLSSWQLRGWRSFFEAADRDRTGTLSRAEVMDALRHFGFSLPDHVSLSLMAAFDE